MAMVNAEFLQRKLLTEDLAVFRFKANVKDFIPGQFNALQVNIYRTKKPLTH